MTNEEMQKRLLELVDGLKKGATLGDLQGYSPEEIEVIYSLGFSSYQAGHFDEAEKIFRFTCMFAHLESKYYLALGGALAAQRKYAEAIPTYAYVLMLDLNNVEAYACVTGGSSAATGIENLVKVAQQVSQGVIGGLQGVQTVGTGIVDTVKANAEYNQAVASANVKQADAGLMEVKEFLQQNADEIQDLVERMEAHFRSYRALIASKASTLLHLAENI